MLVNFYWKNSKNVFILVFVFLSFFASHAEVAKEAPKRKNQAMAEIGPISVKDTLSGKSFLAIQKAATEFMHRQKVDLTKYNITLLQEGEMWVVIFKGKEIAPGTFGHIPSSPGFEVELNSHDLTVLRSNFVR